MAEPPGLSDGVAVRWRPPAAELEALSALLAPWRALTDPVFLGLEHIPRKGPVVLVGNHSIFGMLEQECRLTSEMLLKVSGGRVCMADPAVTAWIAKVVPMSGPE